MDPTDDVRYDRIEVRPLDRQFGVHPALSVPAGVSEIVFGQVNGTGATPFTYALFDAARVDGLSERLVAAATPHDCLVRGRSREGLGAVSPWLVQLRADSRLCRDLFTAGTAPWELWGREAYILMRSHDELATLVEHLRHFTKLRDSKGQWHFFRFQEPLVMRTIVMGLPDDARRSFLAPFQRMIVPDRSDILHVFDISFNGSAGQ
ncbi:DUF4123 domain-containing protein [Paracoccus lutimaris]|uniref:Uncharacterized protein DUF4123 n=1 Tax=Paracoccus lutimaris TaxID=1490030 RepID=A0A368Z4C8_9RHOB|nr:DUF4123 domain-containing protein [Paracoccus lutimaris]RCW86809.1 uncharacterized protein DUF4123 [Paracoccus lutimaris]